MLGKRGVTIGPHVNAGFFFVNLLPLFNICMVTTMQISKRYNYKPKL